MEGTLSIVGSWGKEYKVGSDEFSLGPAGLELMAILEWEVPGLSTVWGHWSGCYTVCQDQG